MKGSKLVIPALAVILLLSGCSSATSNKLAATQIAAADRQARVDKAITTGCRLFNKMKFEEWAKWFGLAARLDPSYLEVAAAAQLLSVALTDQHLNPSPDLQTQIDKDWQLLGGFCMGVMP